MFDLIAFGRQDWDDCWNGQQHILSRMAQAGHRILYVNPEPTRQRKTLRESLAAWRAPERHLPVKRSSGDLWTLTLPSFAWGWQRSRQRDALLVARTAHRLGFWRPSVLGMTPFSAAQVRALDAIGTAYYAIDDVAAYGWMHDEERFAARTREADCIGHADLTIAASPLLQERFNSLGAEAKLLRSGADVDHYAPDALVRAPVHPELAALPGPRLGFFGQIDDRLDQELVVTLAQRHPEWTFIFAGRVVSKLDISRLRGQSNIHLLGYTPYEKLPSVAKHIDVWLLPYVHVPLTEACDPLQVCEYLSTGKPVVSVSLDGLGPIRHVLNIADGPEAFARAIGLALVSDDPVAETDRRGIAQANSWGNRVATLTGWLDAAREQAAARRGLPLAVLEAMPATQARRRLAPGTGPKVSRARRMLLAGVCAPRATDRPCPNVLPPVLKGPKQIHIVPDSGLGDYIATTPALSALRSQYPTAQISVLYERMREPKIWLSHGLVDRLIGATPFEHAPVWRRVLDTVRASVSRPDAVMSMTLCSLPAQALLLGRNRFFTLSDESGMDTVCGWVLPRRSRAHEAENRLRLVEAMCRRSLGRVPYVRIASVQTRHRPTPTLLDLATRRYVVVHPGGARESRIYPPEQLARALAPLLAREPDLWVVITGTAGERALAQSVLAELPPAMRDRVRITAGDLDLDALSSVIGAAAAVVSVDTGVAHLARAVGAPLVVLFGPENHLRWGPYRNQDAPAIVLRTVVPCAPCRLSRCPAHFCMRLLDPSYVTTAIADLIDGQAAPGVQERITQRSWTDIAKAGFDLSTAPVHAGR